MHSGGKMGRQNVRLQKKTGVTFLTHRDRAILKSYLEILSRNHTD